MVDKKLQSDLRQIALAQRRLGHEEFRIAAARMFEKLKMPAQGFAVCIMHVDDYLTAEEIAQRDKTAIFVGIGDRPLRSREEAKELMKKHGIEP